MTASLTSTPGPWLVRGDPGDDASPELATHGTTPSTDEQPGGFPYFIRQHRELPPGGCHLHLAIGIQRLADAILMAAAPDLLAAVVRLLGCPDLSLDELDPATRIAIANGYAAVDRAQGR